MFLAFVFVVDSYFCNCLHGGEDGFLLATIPRNVLSSFESFRNQASRYRGSIKIGIGLGTAQVSWSLINSVPFGICLRRS